MYSQWQGPIKYYKEGYIHKEALNKGYNDHLLEGDFFVTQQPSNPSGKSMS